MCVRVCMVVNAEETYIPDSLGIKGLERCNRDRFVKGFHYSMPQIEGP